MESSDSFIRFGRRRVALGVFLTFLLRLSSAEVLGQSVLCADNHGKPAIIRRAEGATAFAMENGKWIAFPEGPFSMEAAKEYLPVLINVSNQSFRKGERAISDNGPSAVPLVHSGRFVFNADLEAPTPLENAIIVLSLINQKEERTLCIREIPQLREHRTARISIDQIMPYRLNFVRLERVHFFVNGQEAFSSDLSGQRRNQALDHMVAKRITGVKDATVKPLFVTVPVYPANLTNKIKGEARVTFLVNEKGHVKEPVVTSSTDPAFAEAALQAIHQWRFVPEVKDGSPVEEKVTLPIVFEPPT